MGTTIVDMLRRSADHRSDCLAYVTPGGRYTWRQVVELADRLAAVLYSNGVRKGDRVALLLHDGTAQVGLTYAIARLGAIRVGVNYRLSIAEIEALLSHSGSSALVVEDDLVDLVPNGFSGVRILAGDAQGDLGELGQQSLTAAPLPELNPVGDNDVASICYTTGSTGTPKGAIWTHKNVVHSLTNTALDTGMTADDVWLHCLPGAGVPGLLGIWNCVLGWTIVTHAAFDPAQCLDSIEAEGVTSTVWVPTMLGAVIAAQEAQPRNIGSLRKIVYGSAPATPALIRRALATFPSVQIEQWYGSTEGAGGWYTRLTPQDHTDAVAGAEHLLQSAGRAMHHVDLQIRDGDEVMSAGETGEVWVRGDFVMQGYVDAPELTAESLDGEWLCTGDLGYLSEDRYLFLVDRKQFMIITGGYNVYPVEIENALAEHPVVAEVCVFGIPDERWGEAIKALVVLAPGATATENDLRDFVRDRLATFKVPKSIEFRDELVHGPTGKISKRAHKDEYWAESESS